MFWADCGRKLCTIALEDRFPWSAPYQHRVGLAVERHLAPAANGFENQPATWGNPFGK